LIREGAEQAVGGVEGFDTVAARHQKADADLAGVDREERVPLAVILLRRGFVCSFRADLVANLIDK
jgi:hypothetical protein